MTHSLSFDDLQNIADSLAAGFQALLHEVSEQKKVEENLRYRLARIIEKYEQPDHSHNSSSGEISDWRDEIVKHLDAPSYEPTSHSHLSDKKIYRAQQALECLTSSKMPSSSNIKRCPVTLKLPDQEDFEHDFTTPGRVGDLGCPFAKMQSGPVGACGPDPIAEEFHGEKSSARSKGSAQTGSRCPIRFLDKHSPEEIAQYFENHKHEIPRSHEICVKRYQQNEHSIRQLDAKYGNLVSMIQGLGNKHKAYLPENEKVADEPEQDSTKVVEKWAENISHQSVPVDNTDRIPHFERPLRDIRVGESPSRPWGIPVPADKSPAASVSLSEHEAVQPSIKIHSTDAIPAPAEVSVEAHAEQARQGTTHSSPSSHPQIIFNGPVFFGYSPEEAAIFLQKIGAGGSI